MENGKYVVLVAEDEQASRFLYLEELSEEGYEVLTAENGFQALGFLEDRKVNLLITDVKMPDMHALEMIPKVREEHPDLPIIVASAFKGMEDDFTLKEFNVSAFYAKPVNMDALKIQVKYLLESKAVTAA